MCAHMQSDWAGCADHEKSVQFRTPDTSKQFADRLDMCGLQPSNNHAFRCLNKTKYATRHCARAYVEPGECASIEWAFITFLLVGILP